MRLNVSIFIDLFILFVNLCLEVMIEMVLQMVRLAQWLSDRLSAPPFCAADSNGTKLVVPGLGVCPRYMHVYIHDIGEIQVWSYLILN